ncbi:hexokinase-domain-containing protein [Gilbertella persicaria]|uniref:Phosphotransferase n=1 Tax=Rhizopus stolonifer TaxID=4846 RepID=A0A367KCB0_RHIST|nr:hexokinase-domain-containing protein [Gilbertella persicaria]KAI8056289.1 hexokinase-domain-containing protein [Gilbertella persicaria]RCH99808.1 glucokinase [Rhizopus stolonifer]
MAPVNNSAEAQAAAAQVVFDRFKVTTETLRTITDQFVIEMEKGLDHQGATIAMIPSFVAGRCTGEEKGTFMALDLGGTNLRVCQVTLLGGGEHTIHQQKYVISEELKTGPMRHLCDFIADCVDSFLTEHGSSASHEVIQLGYTFSFPVLQTSINRGVLKQWTKGFNCSGAVGKDVTILLQDSFRRKNLNVNIAAIVNDTVGTLMAYAYKHPNTTMGVILGTGFNASYYEDMSKVKKWTGDKTSEMVINMECGAFDIERRVLPLTVYDNKMDRESVNVHQQLHEKMVAGMYLGEITRNAILDLVDQLYLFDGKSSRELNKNWSFETAYMSTIEVDETPELSDTAHILESVLNIPSTTLADRQIVKRLCNAVGLRAARIAACHIAGVMRHTGKVGQEAIIAIDGSLYEFYPNFEKNMGQALSEIIGEQARSKVTFDLARDGSGLGAAIIAMIAARK